MINDKINDNINELTRVYVNNEYKTIGTLKNIKPINKLSKIINNIHDTKIRFYLSAWFYKNYDENKFNGYLTERIKNLSVASYTHIINTCFNDIDPITYYKEVKILNNYSKDIIIKLNSINPQSSGIFFDHLIRRIICEIKNKNFNNNSSIINNCLLENIEKKTVKYLRLFCNIRYINIPYKVTKKTDIVRLIHNYILDNNLCETEFKCNNNCKFLNCQYLSNIKTTDTIKFKSMDILKDILITSYCHHSNPCMWINNDCETKFSEMISVLDTIDTKRFIDPLIYLCKELLANNESNILLNCNISDCNYGAEFDLLIDDMLIDIKCTKNNNTKYELYQLMGYTGLITKNKPDIDIKNICIMNLLKGVFKIYNIENIPKKCFLDFLTILNNEYSPNDRTFDILNKSISYPSFITKYKETIEPNEKKNILDSYSSDKINNEILVKNVTLNEEQNMNVVDFILNKYGNMDRFKKKLKTNKKGTKIEQYRAVEFYSTHINNSNSYEDDISLCDNPNNKGYTINHIKLFCKNFDINMICIINEEIKCYDISNKKKIPSLVIKIIENNTNVITDKYIIQRLTKKIKCNDFNL